MKNWIFDDPFHKKGLILVIWVLGMIKSLGSVDFLMKWGCWGHWGHWGCWGHWGHWGCRGFKAWKITTEDFKFIQVFEFSFIFMFYKKFFGVESWNIILNLSTFSVGGCWGQSILLFWKQMVETQVKCPHLLKSLGNQMMNKYWPFYPSAAFSFDHFTLTHPVLHKYFILQFFSRDL